MRVLHITEMQQKIIKLHIDGKTNEEIMFELNVVECDVYLALLLVDRYLPKVWFKSVNECWRILKEWNLASALVLFICLAPAFQANNPDNHNQDRTRTPRTSRTVKNGRSARKDGSDDINLFDLFEVC